MRSHHPLLSASQRLNSLRVPAKTAMRPLITLLVLSLCLFPTLATAASPHIYVVPQVGPPTSQTQLVGNGFDPNATLDIYFDSTDVGLVDTDNNGSFGLALKAPTIRQNGLTIQIPKDAVPGQHWITAVERITQLQAQVPFTVRTDWPQFQFDPQHTGLNPYENVLSPATVGNLTTRWTYAVQGPVYSWGLVANGMVYAGTDGYDFYALDADTGQLLWSDPSRLQRYSGPSVADGIVYFIAEEDYLYLRALNANTGAQLWQYTLVDDYVASTPTVANGMVYVSGTSSQIYALDGRTGALLWTLRLGGPDEITVANGVIYLGDTYLYALDARTGATLWKFPGARGFGLPVVANGIVYSEGGDSTFYAVDASTGTLLWSYWPGYSFFSYPVVGNGAVYFAAGTDVLVLDAGTGVLLSTFHFPSPPTSLALANGVLWVGSGYTNALYALDAKTGTHLWSYTLGTAWVDSPVVVNGVAYVGDESGKLFAFGLPNQQIAEKFSPPQRPDPARLTPNWSPQPNKAVINKSVKP